MHLHFHVGISSCPTSTNGKPRKPQLMRRSPIPEARTSPDDLVRDTWLNLEMLATAGISSEDPRHPIEHALEGREEGWRSLLPGPQVIIIRFDDPQMISRVHLHFHEAEQERSQEFALFATTKEAARKEIGLCCKK